MSILMSIMQLITIPVQGITQGIQPIISYNYGAGNKERVKDTMKRMIPYSSSLRMIRYTPFRRPEAREYSGILLVARC